MTDPTRRVVLRRSTARGTVALAVVGLLAGCGAAPTALSGPAPSGLPPVGATPAPTTTVVATPTPAPTSTRPRPSTAPTPTHARAGAAPSHHAAPAAPTAAPGPVRLLPWPTTNQTRLQAAADGGAEPWLLDPADLAMSYVSATYGWNAATATRAAGGTATATTVTVHNPDGATRKLTVAQPHRTGPGGIWLVTADARG